MLARGGPTSAVAAGHLAHQSASAKPGHHFIGPLINRCRTRPLGAAFYSRNGVWSSTHASVSAAGTIRVMPYDNDGLPSHRTPCVLVLEDHPDSRRYLSRLLQLHGYTVFEASTCADARDVLRRERCDVLVSDVSLPDCSGFAFMRELRENGAVIRGVAVSGHTGPDQVRAAKAAGFERHVSKPVHFDDLVRVIREISN
jgi:CheY-like chemotaxis protein